MNTEHARGIVALLENPFHAPTLVPFFLETQRLMPSPRPYPPGLRHGQLQWKWFLRGIGKQACLVGLLPFIEVVRYLKDTPAMEGDDYRRVPEEEMRLFDRKAALVTAWTQTPSRTIKRELISLLGPASGHRGYDVFVVLNGGSPAQVAVAFLNWLALILVGRRHFHNSVFWAFKCLAYLGYPDWLACRIFKENVARHFARQLESPSVELNSEGGS